MSLNPNIYIFYAIRLNNTRLRQVNLLRSLHIHIGQCIPRFYSSPS